MHTTKSAFLIWTAVIVSVVGGHAQDGIVSIDNVTYSSPTQLRAGHVHQVSIRYNCLGVSSTALWTGDNVFEIYSPDGADWGYLQGSAGPLVATAASRGTLQALERHYYYDGDVWTNTTNNGSDPAGGSGGPSTRAAFRLTTVAPFFDAGYLGGSDNDIALILEFTTNPSEADMGLHICIDSTNDLLPPPASTWAWSTLPEEITPLWDNGLGVSGPRCWELVNDGIVSIDNVTYSSPTQLRAGHVHQVSIRYDFLGLSSTDLWIGDNGFEIYSPDGADWGSLQGSAGPLVATAAGRGTLQVLEQHYYYDGAVWTKTPNNGSDPAGGSGGPSTRAAFRLATIAPFFDAGYLGGSDNDIALTLEFTTNPSEADMGLHICVDSTYNLLMFPYTTTWDWSTLPANGPPLWDNGLGVSGPRCWELVHDWCCSGRVGDANGIGGDEPTIGDVSAMIDAKFIAGTCDGILDCFTEADINQSGGSDATCDDITIGDISYLIDYLFITGPTLGLPECL